MSGLANCLGTKLLCCSKACKAEGPEEMPATRLITRNTQQIREQEQYFCMCYSRRRAAIESLEYQVDTDHSHPDRDSCHVDYYHCTVVIAIHKMSNPNTHISMSFSSSSSSSPYTSIWLFFLPFSPYLFLHAGLCTLNTVQPTR